MKTELLPFTRDQFLAVFATYNEAIWPLQIIAYLIGSGILVLLYWRSPQSGRLITAGLALMWIWTGIAYHVVFFSAINAAAYGFGAIFVIEALLLIYYGAIRSTLQFAVPTTAPGWIGATLAIYSTLLYPLIGTWTGHQYPALPMFGITPCPVTLFTLGMLLLTTSRIPILLLVVPLIWSLIGGSAAYILSIAQDWVLLLSGVVVVPLLVLRDRRRVQGEIKN
jgi:hypothetical protein